MNVHLIDGTFELFRAHFGAPAAQAPDGQQVGAVRGLLRSLLALLGEDGTTHLACAFDHVIESFRNQLFDGYKTGAGLDPVIVAQFPLAEEAAFALGLVVWPMVEFEADDALATFAARAAALPQVERVLICSPDKDLAQCVQGERVVLCDRMRKRVLGDAGVREKYGVPPGSIPDLLALVGDTADGIPGLPRWGAKSAAQVLSRYPHIDEIPDDPAGWDVAVRSALALGEILRTGRAQARLYRQLATLRTDVPLSQGLADLRWQGARREALHALCARLGEERLLDRVHRWRD